MEQAVSVFLLASNYAHRYLKHSSIGVPFLRELALQVIASPMIWNCLTCKHSAYQEEDEVRLVVLGKKTKFRKYRRTRQRNGKAVPYIESNMPLHERGSICKIIIGPAAPKTAKTYVRKVLKDAGIKFAIPIRRSKIPYRSFIPVVGDQTAALIWSSRAKLGRRGRSKRSVIPPTMIFRRTTLTRFSASPTRKVCRSVSTISF